MRNTEPHYNGCPNCKKKKKAIERKNYASVSEIDAVLVARVGWHLAVLILSIKFKYMQFLNHMK